MNHKSQGERVVIVGAGIIGIACAHFLSREGFQVTVIDKGTVAGACSHGNCGYICPSHVLPLTQPSAIREALASVFNPKAAFRVKPRFSPAFWNWLWQFAIRCNDKDMKYAGGHLKAILDSSIYEYRSLVSELQIDAQWRDSGLLYVFQKASGLAAYEMQDKFLNDEFGVKARRIKGSDLPGFDPALKSGLAGGFLYEGDAFVNPGLLGENWAHSLKQSGVIFIENCSFRQIEKVNKRVTNVVTDKQSIPADHVLIAAGVWSAGFAKTLGCKIPIEPGKGYSVTMKNPRLQPQHPMLFPEHHVGVSPFADSYRLGSMMEFVGFNESIPEHRIEQLKKSAEPYLLEPHSDVVVEEWFGWRPMTWDSLPIIGRVPDMENAYLATGHNMLGMSLAAGTGKLITEIIQGKTTHIDSSAYSPTRF
jgi:D-amino-acid dehydrogenase